MYVRKEIVHNKHVVEQLRERGAIFVEEETEVPAGETVVFSAHGVAPSVHQNAESRRLKTIDATCPLVTKVHVEAKKFAAEGYTIVLIGHAGHEEVEGTMGEAPEHFVLVETEEDVDALELEDPDRVAYLTQTTLSVDETDRIIRRLRERFPNITGSQVRRHLLRHHQPSDGRPPDGPRVRSRAGHRIEELIELQSAGGGGPRPRRRLSPDRQRDPGAGGVARGQAGGGHQLGASAPEELVQRLVEYFRSRGTTEVSEFEVVQEDVRFMLPRRSVAPWRRGRELNPVEPQAGALGSTIPAVSCRPSSTPALTARHRPRPPGS